MAVVKGMLMQSEGKKGVIITPDGEFINVILPNEHAKLGEEVEAVRWQKRKTYKYILTVAAVLLMVLLIPGYQHFYPNEAMAYVALDINPSVELAVNEELKISAVQGLNSDGEKIVSEVDITGMQLYQALPLLVEQAITDGYLESGRENVVLSTVTITENKEVIKIEENKIQQAINEPIQNKKLAARVVVEQSSTTEREEAKKVGISTGKYLIYKEAQKNGVNLTVDEVRNQGIYQLEQQKKVKVEQTLQKQPLYNMLEQQLPPGQRKQLQQIQQHITPEQIEQFRKQLQRLPMEPEKVQEQLNQIMQKNWTEEQAEEVRNHNRIEIIEHELKEQNKELNINSNQLQKLPPGLEKKDLQGNPRHWTQTGIEKKLEAKQQGHPQSEKLRQDKQHTNKHKNNDD